MHVQKWQQLWVVLGQANTSHWLLAIYKDKNNWIYTQQPLTIHQIVQLHSFTDKQTYDGLQMFRLKFAGGHKISFACGTQKQKNEWLTAVQKALGKFIHGVIWVRDTISCLSNFRCLLQ